MPIGIGSLAFALAAASQIGSEHFPRKAVPLWIRFQLKDGSPPALDSTQLLRLAMFG